LQKENYNNMNKICTDIEQSKKLIELGIDVNTADMYHAPDANVIVAEPYIMKTEDETLIPAYKGAIPAWSLTALLGLMSTFTLNGFGNGQFNCRDERANSYALVDTCPLDAAFETVCWLKENNKL
jgi:hypothetical protein